MDTPQSLTFEEAAQRVALLDVTRYDIAVDLTGIPDAEELRAVSTITFECREPGSSTFVDCGADLVAATLNGEAVGTVKGARLELPDLAGSNVLIVETVQREVTQGRGVNRVVDPTDKEIYLWTSFEPDEARFSWACFDQPDLKAPHHFTVTAPERWTVLSNSGDPTVTTVASGRQWEFADTPPLSTYVVVVNAGPFCERRADRDGYELGLFARASLEPMLARDADEIFDLTATGLRFFGEHFGMPFPQRCYHQVFVPGLGGAMENYGCVTWGDFAIYRSAPTADERHLRARILLHEMAHMWFGDIVTMRWWEDLWLNESFAEWACHWAAAEATEFTDAWANFLASLKLAMYAVDRGPTTHPIRQSARDVAEATARFDQITYTKGASVLKQLVAYVGLEQFLAGLRSYFRKYGWANAGFQDLIDELSAASGRDLVGWASEWLDRSGADVFSMEEATGGLVLTAEGPAGSPTRPHRLLVGGYTRVGEGLSRTSVVDLEVTSGRTAVDGLDDAELVLVNDEDLTYAAIRPGEHALSTMLDQAAQLPTPLARVVAIGTAWDLLIDGRLDAARVVRCINRVLEVETSDSIVEAFLERSLRAAEFWTPGDERPALLNDVADTCLRLASSPTRRTVALRALARSAGTDEQLAMLRGIENDVDLEWRVLTRLAALDQLDSAAVDELRERDPNPDVWIKVETVEAARPDAEAKAAAWDAIAVSRTIPTDGLQDIVAAFWQPAHAELLEPFGRRYLELLPTLSQLSMIPAMALSMVMFPRIGVTADFLDDVDEALRDDSISPIVLRGVRQSADELSRMLEARDRGARDGSVSG